MSTFRQVKCTRFCGSSIHSVHAVKSTCQYIRIFKIIQVEYHTFDKLPVTMYLNIIIRWCTVPVEICAAILYVGLWGIVFWRWLAPFTCAALPSNHHKMRNSSTQFCRTAHLNRTSSFHYSPQTSLLSEVADWTLSSRHICAARTIAQCLEYQRATQEGQTAVMRTKHQKEKPLSAPPPPRSPP